MMRLSPAQTAELESIWEKDHRLPTTQSRTAWADARNLKPEVVTRFFTYRRSRALKMGEQIPSRFEQYDLPENLHDATEVSSSRSNSPSRVFDSDPATAPSSDSSYDKSSSVPPAEKEIELKLMPDIVQDCPCDLCIAASEPDDVDLNDNSASKVLARLYPSYFGSPNMLQVQDDDISWDFTRHFSHAPSEGSCRPLFLDNAVFSPDGTQLSDNPDEFDDLVDLTALLDEPYRVLDDDIALFLSDCT